MSPAAITELSHAAQQALADTHRAVRAVQELTDIQSRVDDLIHVLTATTRQTAVLALNVSVEARRLGQAGGGLALVARQLEEVARDTLRLSEQIGQHGRSVESAGGTLSTITARTGTHLQSIGAALAKLTTDDQHLQSRPERRA